MLIYSSVQNTHIFILIERIWRRHEYSPDWMNEIGTLLQALHCYQGISLGPWSGDTQTGHMWRHISSQVYAWSPCPQRPAEARSRPFHWKIERALSITFLLPVWVWWSFKITSHTDFKLTNQGHILWQKLCLPSNQSNGT